MSATDRQASRPARARAPRPARPTLGQLHDEHGHPMDGYMAVGIALLLPCTLVDAGGRSVNGLSRLEPLQPQALLNGFYLICKGLPFIA